MRQVADWLQVSDNFADKREAVFLLPCTKAISLCERDGFRRISPSLAIWLLNAIQRRRRLALRSFVSRLRLTPRTLDTMDDAQLSNVVSAHIRTGYLVGVREGNAAGRQATNQTAEQRRLVRKIEGRGVGGRLNFAGRRHKLVADVDLGTIPGRDHYEVVRHDEAVQVLARLAEQPAGSDFAELLRQASKQLSPDWRLPISRPDGLVLLRHVPVVASYTEQKPAITPSQMAKLMASDESVTLEVVVLDFEDKPLAGITYAIEAPDAESYEGDLGASAKTKITSTKKGSAGVALAWPDTTGAV